MAAGLFLRAAIEVVSYKSGGSKKTVMLPKLTCSQKEKTDGFSFEYSP